MPSVLQVVFSTVSAGLGVIFNGYILFVLLWNRRIHTANRVLLLHLAFVDTVFCLVILLYNTSLSAVFTSTSSYGIGPEPMSVSLFVGNQSTSRLCQGHGFVWTLLPVVVVWNVCGLSCDRYAAISTPLHYSRLINTRRASYFVAASWFVGAALALPPLMGVCPYTFWDARWACAATCTSATTSDLGYAVGYVTFAVVLPVAIILMCNLHMLLIARYHRHRIVSAIYEVTLRAQATVTHQRNPCYLSKFKGRSALFTIAQLVGSLAVLTIPYYSVLVWEAANGRAGNAVFVSVATILLTCTPPVNAYVYGVKSRVLRQTLKRLLQRHLYQKDIDRRLSEIFSETGRRPPLSRRMSAPAGYGRKTSQVVCQMDDQSGKSPVNKISYQAIDVRQKKYTFIRSYSLPVNELCITNDIVSHDPYHTDVTSQLPGCADVVQLQKDFKTLRSVTRNHILLRGESAPEGNCVVNDTQLEVGNGSTRGNNEKHTVVTNGHCRKTLFIRSSSFPETQRPNLREPQKARLFMNGLPPTLMTREPSFEQEEPESLLEVIEQNKVIDDTRYELSFAPKKTLHVSEL